MKAKISDSNKNCFSFPDGYSLSLSGACAVSFVPTTGITAIGHDNGGIGLANPVP